MKFLNPLLLTLIFFSSQSLYAGWLVKERIERGPSSRLSSAEVERSSLDLAQAIVLRDLPYYLEEHAETAPNIFYRETYYPKGDLPQHLQLITQNKVDESLNWPDSEVRTLREQGPVANRIDLVIVGDGYTLNEKDRFFADAERITDDLFNGQTFADYLPLFNVHAVFVPSSESGLTDGRRVNTALGLYRTPVGSKRAIMPGNSSAIERAIRLAPDSDYPILMANDDYYGGLGGRYAITTRSINSGSMVLRHELGHNFGDVGEEYDGGAVYSGANSSRSPQNAWGNWIETPPRRFENQELTGTYVWKNLSQGAVRVSFNFPSGGRQLDSTISTVGWETVDDVHIYLDGSRVEIDGVYTKDRSFFRIRMDRSLSPGRHELVIQENRADGDNVLAFARLYALEADLDIESEEINGFATFNQLGGHAGYRPTHDQCLMRNMRRNHFCPVDLENMWKRFLARVRLIDGVDQSSLPDGTTRLTVRTPDLLGLQIRWFKKVGGSYQEIRNGSPNLELAADQRGDYRVNVEFHSNQVRSRNSSFSDQREIELR